jgi:cytosine/creatinine deaminase
VTEATAYDLVVRRARLRDRDDLVDIGIRGGAIMAVSAERLDGDGVVDAAGNLVVPSFVDAHLHACKAHTFTVAGDDALHLYTSGGMARADEAIRRAAAVKDRYAAAWNADNARRAFAAGLRHGVTKVLAFADTDTRARLEGVTGVLAARDELREVMDIRVVAFPQDGVVCDPGAADFVRQGLELGADVVGGIPWIERNGADQQAHIDAMLALATEFDRDVAMLTDDAGDPALRTTEMLARAAVRQGWEGRVVVCHARAMSAWPDDYFRGLLPLLRDAGVRFVTDPHTGALHLRALELRAAGIPVALGQDDIADAYYPFGQHNLLEVAFLAAHLWRLSRTADLDMLLDLVTTDAAAVFGGERGEVAEGAPADIAVLGQPTVVEALRLHEPPRAVIARGRLVAENRTETRYHPPLPDGLAE